MVSANLVWVRWVQREIVSELEDSAAVKKGVQGEGISESLAIDNSRDKKARTGKFKRLAPWKDQEEVWRVGGRNRLTAPFTDDGKPVILLPANSRYTYLAMLAAHNKAHPGGQQTLVQFRQD